MKISCSQQSSCLNWKQIIGMCMKECKHTLMNKCYDINIRALLKKKEEHIKQLKEALNFYTSEQNLFNIGGGINDVQERQRRRKVSPCIAHCNNS